MFEDHAYSGYGAIAFDSGRNVTVGCRGNGTFEWDGISWDQVAGPEQLGTNCYEAAMAYDSDRGVSVLASREGGLWEWDGNTWVERYPAQSPTWIDYMPAMAYDSGRGVTVLYDGFDIWEWDGSDWTQHTAAGPPQFFSDTMTYDEARGEILLFTSTSGAGASPGHRELWAWDGAVWSFRSDTGPFPRFGAVMVFDTNRQTAILHGGLRATDTWQWDGSEWTILRASGMGDPLVSVYDNSRHAVVTYGENATWDWTGMRWLPRDYGGGPIMNGNPGMVYDSDRGVSVLFGGSYHSYGEDTEYFDDTWEWDGDAWTLRASSGPEITDHSMAYDSGRGVTVLYGTQETWEWEGQNWVLRAQGPQNAPTGWWHTEMAYDSVRGVSVLYGGSWTSGGWDLTSEETWEWDGQTWTLRSTVPPENFSSGGYMTYDSRRNRVMFMGVTGNYELGLWEWDGTSWLRRAAANLHDVESFEDLATLSYDEARGVFVFLSAAQTWELKLSCMGDLNCDEQVDWEDLVIVLMYYGCTGGDCRGDVDLDGDVDLADVAELLGVHGTECE
jgi:hypothetical protein